MKSVNPAFNGLHGSFSALADLTGQQRLRLLSPRKWFRDALEINTDPSLLDHRLIFGWLEVKSPDTRHLALALSGSLCFGLYRNERQIGFARIVTDMAEIAVIRDLYISPEYRFIGLGSWLLSCCVSHPAARGCSTILCLSETSQEFLEKCGFTGHPALPGIYGLKAGHPGYAEAGLSDHLLRH
ncbi:GNAT family N-acetyltransferase [Pantoea sp. Pa-EAmG]|uniref:GNAT family N-acetyltransferase n=1 Tax=Pantoea sp. Pa-EAmG TaxID=3043311 RepID=UPI0024AFE778|nr:GNAT family N-acetyltransferase [Pantoea sp. Pa-EAmG]MDI6958500.1 GNAT family N-acetyltransferase [Pantoea sp. Pa-EAmG]